MSPHVSDRLPVVVPAADPSIGVNHDHGDRVSVSEILRILRRRMRVIAATVLVLLAATAAFILAVRPLYTATATVMIDPSRPNAANFESGQSGSQAPQRDDAAIESQVLLIQSVAVLRRVVDDLNLTQDPDFSPQPGILDAIVRLFSTPASGGKNAEDIARDNSVALLQKRLKIVRQRNTLLVDIDVSAHDPAKAANVANGIVNAYFTELINSKSNVTKIAADWFKQQVDKLKSRVLAADKAAADFRAANNLIMTQGATVNDQQVTDLNGKLVEARAEAAQARAKYEQVAQIAKTGGDPGSVAEALSSDTIARLRAQYADLAKNEADLSTRYGRHHPLLAAVRAQLHDTQKLINAEVQRILQSRRHIYEAATARADSLQKSLNALLGVSTDSGQAEIRLRELQREAEANRTLYEAFLARYKEQAARETLEMPEARIVTSASAPIRPSFPKTILMLGLVLPLGAAFGSLLAIAIDRSDKRVKTLDQAEAVSGVPGIAAIPLIGVRELSRITKRGRRVLERYDANSERLLPLELQPPLMRYTIEEPNSIFAEAVRAVRLVIQRTAKSRPVQVVMLTSAVDGEGKSTLATNLALSHAMIGMRTLLLEGDLRNPEMTRSLCPQATVGLLDVALGRASLREAILVDQTTSLSILPSPLSATSDALIEFIFSKGMGTIFAELRRHYDMIIVDAPPLMPLVDGRALGEHADGIVVTIGWDHTPEDVVARALGLLSTAQDRILGTVLTRVDLVRLRFYDYYRSSAYIKPYDYGAATRQQRAAL